MRDAVADVVGRQIQLGPQPRHHLACFSVKQVNSSLRINPLEGVARGYVVCFSYHEEILYVLHPRLFPDG